MFIIIILFILPVMAILYYGVRAIRNVDKPKTSHRDKKRGKKQRWANKTEMRKKVSFWF